ncbi:venom peptide isomerase heavy chain [Lepeophtheirus salmonis]|uniref:venom peptide isomerase heavy chain n=1 Tax=Lepeophtheirus salmonis TaxID=72036 RepID=UPI001AE4944C|nr:phenoloxidase-activating factor 3-like [Lepeophtheirus salmonis]
MFGFNLILIILSTTDRHVLGNLKCNITIFGGPAPQGIPCIFPFVYYGKKYDKCTTAYEADERPWCATRIIKNSRELRGDSNDWGYCDSKCPFIDFFGKSFKNGTTIIPPSTIITTASPTRILSSHSISPGTTSTDITFSTTPHSRKKSTISHSSQFFSNGNDTEGTWIPNQSKNECGNALNYGFIFGGKDATLGEFPFVALLGYESVSIKRNYDYLCGGVLINRRYVITAAHCETDEKPIKTVVLGEFDIRDDPDCRADCRMAQRFNKDNDIALIRLPRLVTTIKEDAQTFVSPICLPNSNPSNNPSSSGIKELTVVGWGKTSYERNIFINKGIGSEILQKLKLNVVPFSICKDLINQITKCHICALGKDGEDSCNGDSGSPLIYVPSYGSPMVLQGIVSSGSYICGIGVPGIYTKIDSYVDWIKSNLKP